MDLCLICGCPVSNFCYNRSRGGRRKRNRSSSEEEIEEESEESMPDTPPPVTPTASASESQVECPFAPPSPSCCVLVVVLPIVC